MERRHNHSIFLTPLTSFYDFHALTVFLTFSLCVYLKISIFTYGENPESRYDTSM